MIRGSSRRTLAVGSVGLACAFAVACNNFIGPVRLTIQTGGQRYEDFVIRPIQEFGRLHSSEIVPMPLRVVASETEIVIRGFSPGPSFAALKVSAYHPEFTYAWTAASSFSREGTVLPAIAPRLWSEFLAEHGEVSMRQVQAHLDRLRESYVPAFTAGDSRRRLAQYIPSLRSLVDQASWLPGDSGSWPTADAGRADLIASLQALSESLR